jgi:hypothetical protein
MVQTPVLVKWACRAAFSTAYPTFWVASVKRRGRPHNELMKIAVTLTAIASQCHRNGFERLARQGRIPGWDQLCYCRHRLPPAVIEHAI